MLQMKNKIEEQKTIPNDKDEEFDNLISSLKQEYQIVQNKILSKNQDSFEDDDSFLKHELDS